MSEPNVLLLDRAAFRLDDGPWHPEEDMLRLDNRLRTELGWPLRGEVIAQPWSVPLRGATHLVQLRYTVHVAVAVSEPLFALEGADGVRIDVDGVQVTSRRVGSFVDQAIETVALPPLAVGTHEIVLTLPYGPGRELEWCYLLGDFGVELHGCYATVVAPVRKLAFGDWTRQGLPFYAGNVVYHCGFELPEQKRLGVRVPHFAAPLLRVALGNSIGTPIAFAPFHADLGVVSAGRQRLMITAYGNRFNTFGCLHNVQRGPLYAGPEAWRTTGDAWADSYQIKPMGLLGRPRLFEA